MRRDDYPYTRPIIGEDNTATPAYLKAFKDFIALSPGFHDDPEMLKEFYAGSDRASVILLGSFVENILVAVLKSKMRPDLSNTLEGRLVEGNGPISTFSAKIHIAFAFELFGPVFLHDLNLIRELRNAFAHVQHPMTLSTPQIAEVCKHLKLADDRKLSISPMSYFEHSPDQTVAKDKTHPRTRFTVTCHTISISLLQVQSAILNRAAYTLP